MGPLLGIDEFIHIQDRKHSNRLSAKVSGSGNRYRRDVVMGLEAIRVNVQWDRVPS